MESAASTSEGFYDFLYADHRRIGSLLAQLSEYGLAERIVTSNVEEETAKSGIKRRFEEGVATATQITFDPLWGQTRHFIRIVQEQKLDNWDLERSFVGQIVSFAGNLVILDLRTVKELWPALADEIHTLEPDDDLVTRLLNQLPHTVQATFTNGAKLWCMLEPEYLVTSPEALLLKHGEMISGRWFILGVLDAEPETVSQRRRQSTGSGRFSDVARAVAVALV